jgi:hypothetical protein
MNNKFPLARYDDIVVQEVADEILVCNLSNNRVFCLNKTAAEVWRLSDGETDVKQMAENLSRTFRQNVSEEIVVFALQELSNDDLLQGKYQSETIFKGLSRREVIRRVGIASMIALPLISSIVMPTAAHAQSTCVADINGTFPNGCSCRGSSDCTSTCCLGAVCGADQAFLFNCGGGVNCPASYSCCTDFNTGTVGQFNCSCTGIC